MPYPFLDDNVGEWLYADSSLIRANSDAAAAFYLPSGEKMFYEVVRVQAGIPLFWEDHAGRLLRSVDGAFRVDVTELRREALHLLSVSGTSPCNLRIVATALHTVLHLSPYYYPSEDMILSGVACGVLGWERETPNIKTVREDYKLAVAGAFAAGGPYGRPFEILLANRTGQFTEGSRSNLFFVKGTVVYSAPDDAILLGITRKYVQRAVAEAGYRLETAMFTMDDLRTDSSIAAFLTGSPIDVLPVSSVGDWKMATGHPAIKAIRLRYLSILEEYVRSASGR